MSTTTTTTNRESEEITTKLGSLRLVGDQPQEDKRHTANTDADAARRSQKLSLAPLSDNSPDWLRRFHDQGYAIIEDVITKDEAKRYVDDWQTWLETWPLGYKRDDKSTWNQEHLPDMFKGGVFFLYNANHEAAAWRARTEPKVLDAFAKLWGTEKLIVSFDSPNISLPIGPRGRADTEPLPAWPHIDADPHDYDFCLPQGFLNFEESGDDDGGLVLLTKSRHHHPQYIAERGIHQEQRQGRDEWYVYKEDDVKWFLEHGSELVKASSTTRRGSRQVNVPAGALVLWDSRTVHWTRSPTGARTRTIYYLCYEPAHVLTEEQRKKKKEIFDARLGTSHSPHLNICPTLLGAVPQRNGQPDPLVRKKPFVEPEITDTVLRLIGDKPYD